jgi:xanthine dehydrogenase YagR molybdenum-binding subunit
MTRHFWNSWEAVRFSRYASTRSADLDKTPPAEPQLLPVNADAGEIEVILVPEIDDEFNPAGVRGIGELGNVGTNAAVANAVYHATGKRVRHISIRSEDLIEA